MPKSKLKPSVFSLLLAGLLFAAPANGNGADIEPRIGLKSEAVLLNDLQQLGLPDVRIIEMGESARVRVSVEDGSGMIEVDRKSGAIRITEGSNAVREALQRKIPSVHLASDTDAAARGDCLTIDPAAVEATHADGRWKVVQGERWLFDFGDARGDAQRAAEVLRHYAITQSCFIGRPDPSFSYLLSSGRAPQGALSGEDCLRFDPNQLSLTQTDGRWKIAQGERWLFDFGSKRSEARQALAVIRQYGFSQSCFVGRPDPGLSYLRR